MDNLRFGKLAKSSNRSTVGHCQTSRQGNCCQGRAARSVVELDLGSECSGMVSALGNRRRSNQARRMQYPKGNHRKKIIHYENQLKQPSKQTYDDRKTLSSFLFIDESPLHL